MSEFHIISSIGHCATAWLTAVLSNQTATVAFHELKMLKSNMAWDKAARYEARYGVDGNKYAGYYDAINTVQADLVVDANSWVSYLLPQVDVVMPIDKVWYITRHGISQIHSLQTSSVWQNSRSNSFIYGKYLEPFFDIAGLYGEWQDLTRWERLCVLWASNASMPEWLDDWSFDVEVLTFEELTQGEGLTKIIPNIEVAEIQGWRATDINRKVEGDRRPPTLWALWNKDQQESFKRICGPFMEQLGYTMP